MQVTELLRDLLFRQVGCTSSQPEISPGGPLPFLTVMHLNLFFLFFFLWSQTRTITEHSPPARLRSSAERRRETKGRKGKSLEKVLRGGIQSSLGNLALFKIRTNGKTRLSHHVL